MTFHFRGISESTRLCGLLLPISAGGFGLLCLVRQSSCPQIHDSFTRRRGGGRAAGMLSGINIWCRSEAMEMASNSVSVQDCKSIPGWFVGRCSKRCDFGRRSVRHGCEKRGWRWGQGQSTSHGESGKLPKKEVFFCKNDPSLCRNCAQHQPRSFSSHTLVFDFGTCLMWVPQAGGRGVALVRGWWGSSEFLLWSGLDQISFGSSCRYHHLILRLTWEVTRVERVVFDDLPQWPQCALAHVMGTQRRSRGGVLHPGMLFIIKKGGSSVALLNRQ